MGTPKRISKENQASPADRDPRVDPHVDPRGTMPLATYVTRKRGVYHLRCRVPLDLVDILGRQEIRRSLCTAEPSTARMLAALMSARVLAGFGEIRRLTTEGKDKKKSWQAEAIDLLEGIMQTQQEIIREQEKTLRLKDQHAALERIALMQMAGTPAKPAAPDPFAGLHEDSRRPLDELLSAFLKHAPQSPKRQAEYEAELARWRRAVGDKPVALINAMDVAAYHDRLLDEVRPRKGGKVASHDTQHKALSALRMVLGWACSPTVALRKAGDNPAEKVRPKGVAKAAKNAIKRRPWKADELNAIFRAPVFTGCLNDLHCLQPGDHDLWWSGRYWLPLLALMTGARIGEIVALRVGDVSVDNGLTYLSVTTEVTDEDDEEDKERTVKTANSIRLLPVHPELERLGLLTYIAGVSKGKKASDPLFERRDYTKFYNNKDRFFGKAGVKSELTSFHSFRHTYKDMVRVLRDSDLRDRLMGHAPRSVGEAYGSPLTPDEAQAFVERVRCPIDLSHLYPENRRVGRPRKA